MDREILAIGNTGAQLVSKFNDNFYTLNRRNWFNVEDYGAVHDNVTDDTEAIQDAINACNTAGGGVVFFPAGIYLISGALQTDVGGVTYNSQLYIPANRYDNVKSIKLLGEVPNLYAQNYGGYLMNNGVILRSTIAGTGTFPSVICSKAKSGVNPFLNYTVCEIENISILVNPFIASGGPSMCGVNFIWTSHNKVKNLICGMDINDRDTLVQPTNHVFGLATGTGNCDFPLIDFYTCWGFYYGLILGEGVSAKNIFCAWNYIGLMSYVNPYGSVVDYVTLHWNAYDIAAQQETIEDHVVGASNLRIKHMVSEDHSSYGPAWTNRVDEILDNDNILYGSMDYYIAGADGVGTANNIVKSHGGNNFLIRNIARVQSSYHWATSERPTDPWRGCTGYNTTSDKMECWDGSQWNNLF